MEIVGATLVVAQNETIALNGMVATNRIRPFEISKC